MNKATIAIYSEHSAQLRVKFLCSILVPLD